VGHCFVSGRDFSRAEQMQIETHFRSAEGLRAGRRLKRKKNKPAYHTCMSLQFTAVFRRVPEGYVAFVEELPGANTQGATLDEARTNLQEAVTLVIEANRTLAQESVSGQDVIRESLKVGA